MSRILWTAMLCASLLLAENIALNKPYSLSNVTNYAPSKDAGDSVQITDGVYTVVKNENFWGYKSTVGWRTSNVISITIDLGETFPIGSFVFSTAFGKAQVTRPDFIYVYVSDNEKEWYYVGDLVTESAKEHGMPDGTTYVIHKFVANMPCKGRHVCFMVKQNPYTFVDEIEVLRGDESLLAKPPSSEKVSAPMVHYLDKFFQTFIEKDIQMLEKRVAALGSSARESITAAIAEFRRDRLGKMSVGTLDSMPIYPIDDNHRALYAINAKCLRAAGFTKPMIWRNNRWDNLLPDAVPPTKGMPEPLEIEMMRGEVRAETLNILNPTDSPLVFNVDVKGLPDGSGLDCREVLGMLTKQMKYSASALKPGNGASISIEVPSGMSKQIWLSFKRPTLKAGLYKATVVATAEKLKLDVPLTLRIHDFDFPKHPRLHVGGCDYMDGDCNYYKSKACAAATIEMMREIYTDSPWATAGVIPKGAKFDADGKLLNHEHLDFSEWDKWTARWGDGIRFYFVFNAVSRDFMGEPMGTPRFNRMVDEFYNAWADGLRKRGIESKRVVLLLVDEPCTEDRDERTIAWAKPIHDSKSGFVIFVNPIWTNPKDGAAEMYASADILCPNTIFMTDSAESEAYMRHYLNWRDKGITLWLNSCSGPARLLDPITYHRGQEWRCFQMGAEGSVYWAFGCGGSIGDSWHPFRQTSTEYSPFMVSPDKGPMDAKQSEGLREGVQDYEYLCMLRDRIAVLKKAGGNAKKIAEAERLLVEAPVRALRLTPVANAPEWSQKSAMMWSDEKDRTHMDNESRRVLRMLSELK